MQAFAATPIRVGSSIWPGYEPLFLANKITDWGKNKSVRMVEFSSATEVTRAFRNRSLEAAALTLDEVLLLREAGLPVTVVLVLDVSRGGDVIMAKPQYKNIKELKNKKFGVESGALGAFVLTRALELHGLTLNDIKIVPIEVNRHESAYRSDLIDAAVTFEPTKTNLAKLGAREVFSSREIPNEIIDVLVVHNKILQSKKAQTRELIQGWFQALQFIKKDPNRAAKLMSVRLKITPHEVLTSFQGLSLPSVKENHGLLSGQHPIINQTVKRLQKTLEKSGLLKQGVNLQGLISAQFIPQ
ncbi:MAG: ABC transporter substrate-binding protein [SAR324 cluster bacterium]|nr:ABC transporter substrate-binding protein [SAR324 cluster bacterium]